MEIREQFQLFCEEIQRQVSALPSTTWTKPLSSFIWKSSAYSTIYQQWSSDEILPDVSLSTRERIIHDYLKITSRYVAHQLTDKQRVQLSHENLTKLQNDTWRW